MQLQTTETAHRIRQLHTENMLAAKATLERAMEIGELLVGVRESLKHGKWLPWLTENVGFAERTARNYIRLYKNRAQVKSASVADLNEAYKLLSPPPELSDTAKLMNRYYKQMNQKERANFWEWAAVNESDPKLRTELERISEQFQKYR